MDSPAMLDAKVREWLRLDRNAVTREQIETIHAAEDYTELAARLGTRIAFGTSGLRARGESYRAQRVPPTYSSC